MMDTIKRILGLEPPSPQPLPDELRESFHKVANESMALAREVETIERSPSVFEEFVTSMREGYRRDGGLS